VKSFANVLNPFTSNCIVSICSSSIRLRRLANDGETTTGGSTTGVTGTGIGTNGGATGTEGELLRRVVETNTCLHDVLLCIFKKCSCVTDSADATAMAATLTIFFLNQLNNFILLSFHGGRGVTPLRFLIRTLVIDLIEDVFSNSNHSSLL
jgi:hypothetical protein